MLRDLCFDAELSFCGCFCWSLLVLVGLCLCAVFSYECCGCLDVFAVFMLIAFAYELFATFGLVLFGFADFCGV